MYDAVHNSECDPLHWEGLVSAGIIDKLCECVAGFRTTLECSFPAEDDEVAGEEPVVSFVAHNTLHFGSTRLNFRTFCSFIRGILEHSCCYHLRPSAFVNH